MHQIKSKQKPKNIFVLFNGRTGSSFFLQVLAMGQDSKVYCEYGEIFTTYAAILRLLKAPQKLNIKGEKELKNFALKHPLKYINFINDNIQPRYFCSKIQIPYLLGTKAKKDILYYPKSIIIIMRRNIIDAYISSKKASHFRKWSNVDTSNFKLTIDFGDFMKYYKKITQNEKRLQELLKDRKYLMVNYEDIHKFKSNREKINYIFKTVQKLDSDFKLDVNRMNNIKLLSKQDNKKRKDKISNYGEFFRFLKTKKLDYLLNQS